jgi:hypothetical protein
MLVCGMSYFRTFYHLLLPFFAADHVKGAESMQCVSECRMLSHVLLFF